MIGFDVAGAASGAVGCPDVDAAMLLKMFVMLLEMFQQIVLMSLMLLMPETPQLPLMQQR